MAFMSGMQGAAFGIVHNEHRRPLTLTDQHGRPWFCNEDKRSGQPVGNLEPKGWSAPVYPPTQYIIRDPEQPYRCAIDYDRLIADHQQAADTWYRAKVREGARLHGQKFKESEEATTQILDIIGPPPTRWEIWEACRQGNRWVLGLTEVVDDRVFKYFPPERRVKPLDFTSPDFEPDDKE